MKKNLPNAITSLNLICGCLAITNAFTGDLYISSFLIFAAAIFDFMDGAAARFLKVSNPLGAQLDSLADMISFGLAPGIILFQYTKHLHSINESLILTENPWLFYLALIIPVFSAFRLAKFNIDTRQTDGFIGLATPANTLFFSCIVLIYFYPDLPQLVATKNIVLPIISNPLTMLVLGIIFSILLVAEIPMFSLKSKSLKWKGNELRFTFLGLFIVLFILLNITSFPIIILIYIIWSIISSFTNKKTLR